MTSLSNPAGGGAGGSTFTYDGNGNMIHKTEPGPISWEYQYDSENRLTRVLKDGNLLVEYGYDGDGGRVKKTDYSVVIASNLAGTGLSFASDVAVSPTVTTAYGGAGSLCWFAL